MPADVEIADLAALLEELKNRSGLSYGTLAKRLHLSPSTLHRYCKGEGLSPEFATVERFARLCKATPEELVELHRRWIAADTARERERDRRVSAPEAPVAAPTAPAPSTAPAPPARRRRPRPRALVVSALALATTLALTAGLLLASRDDESDAAEQPIPTGDESAATEQQQSPPAEDDDPDAEPQQPPPAQGDDPDAEQQQPPPAEDDASDGEQQQPPASEEQVPMTVATRPHAFEDPCGNHYLVDAEPESVPPPPDEPDAPGWARALGAVSAGRQYIELTIQGTGDATVVLRDLHVRVTRTGDPLPWNLYTGFSACGGGPVDTTAFDVDLDAATPQATATGDQPDLPLWVDESDPLVVYVTARTEAHDVDWYLDLEWSSGSREGVLRIDDEGRPFHTSATSGQPEWAFPLGGTDWYTSPDS